MHTKSLLLSLLFATAILVYNSVAIPKPFPYQAHSFNDLNIASHLLRKGVQYFKFDASLANEQSCTAYSTWDRKNSCIQINEYAEQMCCLAMRGDASSAPNFHYPFNTSSQFVTLLDNFLSQFEPRIDILFIAIDFQFGFSFSNSLAQQFMADLATLMNKYSKLHVTTKGDYILEYDRVCRYYGEETATNWWRFVLPLLQDSQGCTPQRNKISQSRFFLQSPSMNLNDPRDYKGRYQNFNIIYTEIDRLCQSGFPNWINRNPSFPLIFWEPSNEEQIQSSLQKLMSPQCQKKHNRSLSGIALASNIDPEMFEIAMKQTGSGIFEQQFPWNFKDKKLWLENATSVKMAKLLNKDQEMLVLYRKIEAFNQTRNSDNIPEHYLSLLSIQPTLKTVVLQRQVEIHEQAFELRGMRDQFILVTPKNGTKGSTRQFDAVLIAYNMRLEPTALLPVSKFITSFASSLNFFFISLSSNPQQLITYRSNASLSTPTQYKLPIFLAKAQIQSISSMFLQPGSDASEKDIYLLLGDNHEKTWVASIENSDEHSIRDLSFGTKSRITQQPSGDIAIFFQNSYAHGGLLINNNGENKCLYHKSDSLKNLATIPYLVDGLKAALKDLLEFAEDQSTEIVTACHPQLTFSKYLNGANIEAQSVWEHIFLSTKRIPINELGFISTLFSGASGFERTINMKKGFLISSVTSKLPLAHTTEPLFSTS